MKKFNSLSEWRGYIKSSAYSMLLGLCRMLWSILLGLFSILCYVLKAIRDFKNREFRASMIIAALLLIFVTGWVTTFVNERAMRVKAEMQRDSLLFRLDSAKQNSMAHINSDYITYVD